MSQHFFYPPVSASIPGTVSADQGDPNTLANAWPVKITDGTDLALVNASGELQVTASALPLPSGAATEATLSSLNGKVTAVNTGAVVVASSALPSGASTESTLSTLNGKVTAVNTGAVVVASSALPSGASTESTLSTLNGKVPANLTVTSTRLLVDGSGVTQPVSGTITTKAGTPTAGTVTQAAVTVGTSAVRCTVAGSVPNSARSLLIVQPDPASTATFYIGSSSVANSGGSRGISVAPGEKVYFNNDAGDYYIISGTAAQTVFIMEQA